MKAQSIFAILFTLLSGLTYTAQSQQQQQQQQQQPQPHPEREKMTNAIIDYYVLDREKIHLHINKSIFHSNEEIWFKGYVYDRKKKMPNVFTSNVFTILTDHNGNKIAEQLLYASNGIFSGSFKLDATFASGTYFIRTNTNWMNNFSEDESSVFRIDIINAADKAYPRFNATDDSKINISFHAEGGNLIAGTTNNIGIAVADCNGNPLPLKEVEIIDSQQQIVRKVPFNSFGYGKFELTPGNDTYKARINYNGKTTEEPLPVVLQRGIALEVNTYALSNRSIIKIRTNTHSLKNYADNPLLMVIQQDSKASFFEIGFEDGIPEQELILSNDYLYEGISTIRILDSELNQVAERIVFKYPKKMAVLSISPDTAKNSSGHFSGKSNIPNANFSITVLPENSVASTTASLYASTLLNPYLTSDVSNAAYYFDQPSKAKHYELDLLLLQQKSRYRWQDILTKPPKQLYDFEYGLTMKGTINQTITNREKYKIKLYSLQAQIIAFSEINEKNEFEFKNLALADSTWVHLSFVKTPDLNTALPTKIVAKIINGKRGLNKNFNPDLPDCAKLMDTIFDMPQFQKGVIQLDNVDVESKFKLKRQMQYGNAMLKGYKITAENNGLDVLNFIQQNGFDVLKSGANINIFGRSRTTINGQRNMPVVFLDNMRLMSLDELWGMRMDEIDEIYLNAHAISPSMENTIGIIKIYRNKINLFEIDDSKIKSVKMQITNGYAKIRRFENAEYSNTADNGFENFGLIDWMPMIMTDEAGDFSFRIPNTNRKKVKILIEGMAPDGTIISEVRSISL